MARFEGLGSRKTATKTASRWMSLRSWSRRGEARPGPAAPRATPSETYCFLPLQPLAPPQLLMPPP